MHVYLIRHAHAEDGDRDAVRPVSSKGKRQIRAISRFLGEHNALDAVEIWHSSLERARATAVLLTQKLRLKADVIQKPGLSHKMIPTKSYGACANWPTQSQSWAMTRTLRWTPIVGQRIG